MADTLRGTAILAHGGAPTHVINATLAGVFDATRQSPQITALYGARNGIRGVVDEDFFDLSRQDPKRIDKIGRTPSSVLGSSRGHVTDEDCERILSVFQAHHVRYFFYNGGNGSMHTAHRMTGLARERDYELRVIGLPKTIDNDLAETDHCPGYGSAARFVACALRDIGADNRSLPSPIEVVEVMGRDAGWLVAASALARRAAEDAPHLIYCPERKLPREQLLTDVDAVYRKLGRVVIALCEGQLDENGEPFGADLADPHSFGYRMTSNLGHAVAEFLNKNLKLRTRSSKPRILGRSSTAFVSEIDRQEAYECGRAAVRAAVAGETGKMVTLVRQPGERYRSTTGLAALEDVAAVTKLFPAEWIDAAGHGVTQVFLDYAAPLAGPIEPHTKLEDVFVEKRVVW
jgi:ATP-dependent phosphofructokinase / diphosphate-dependent phosphofructokinase